MQFSEQELNQLAETLYEDAKGQQQSEVVENGIDYEQLKAQLSKHPGLLENLSIRF